MKKLFYLGTLGLLLFEIASVYFIMPMPGSQEMNSIGIAYFLYSWRWIFRLLFIAFLFIGIKKTYSSAKIFPSVCLLIVGAIIYFANFKMAADAMFLQVSKLILADTKTNTVDTNKLVIGISYNGQAKAYPIQYLGYHHQVRDSIGGKPIMITYCTVCRTAKVFEPIVNNSILNFRLVGMDHFNAMFEDNVTHSWWRQATGEAVAGKNKGLHLPEFPSLQITLDKWIALHPNTLIMQGDNKFSAEYKAMQKFERGHFNGSLTNLDTTSCHAKSWVVGITINGKSKAIDWNKLKQERIIHDMVNNVPIVLILAKDNISFTALQRQNEKQLFTLQNDTLTCNNIQYTMFGKSINPQFTDLQTVSAYQMYWHTWQTFYSANN